jgi:hypothetical protein
MESESRAVRLEQEDPEIMQIYLNWLYRGTLPVRHDEQGSGEYMELAQAYVLGDQLQDNDFTDAVIDAIIDKYQYYNVWPGYNTVSYIFDNTADSAKARRLLVDIYAYVGNAEVLDKVEKNDSLPKAFLYRLAAALFNIDSRTRRNSPQSPRNLKNTCIYHQHGPDPALCYKVRSNIFCPPHVQNDVNGTNKRKHQEVTGESGGEQQHGA